MFLLSVAEIVLAEVVICSYYFEVDVGNNIFTYIDEIENIFSVKHS